MHPDTPQKENKPSTLSPAPNLPHFMHRWLTHTPSDSEEYYNPIVNQILNKDISIDDLTAQFQVILNELIEKLE